MKNLWEMIAANRGLKFDEEFRYSDNEGYVNKINKDGLQFRSKRSGEWLEEDGRIVKDFIAGIGTIEKLPLKFIKSIRITENGERYLYVNTNGATHEACFIDTCAIDLYRRKARNMFPVGSELPQAQIDKIVKEMKE